METHKVTAEIDVQRVAMDMMLAVFADVNSVIRRRLNILEEIIPMDGAIIAGMLQASIAPALKLLSTADWEGERIAAIIAMMAMLEDRKRSGGGELHPGAIMPIEREIADILRPINQRVKEL